MENGASFDYSNMIDEYPLFTDPETHFFEQRHGTFLDKQLHEELCFTRTTMHELLVNNQHSPRAQAFAPMIDQITALAKQEQDMKKALSLSDYAYNLMRIASGGMNILNTGWREVLMQLRVE